MMTAVHGAPLKALIAAIGAIAPLGHAASFHAQTHEPDHIDGAVMLFV